MAKYDINLRDYWRIIRKRRTVVILATILFTVFSYLFAVIRTPEPLYEATSAVKVEKAKEKLFRRSARRNVQISEMQIEENGSSAVVTFKQRYLTAKHRDVGLKTLQLRRQQDRWTILKENWQPIPGQG